MRLNSRFLFLHAAFSFFLSISAEDIFHSGFVKNVHTTYAPQDASKLNEQLEQNFLPWTWSKELTSVAYIYKRFLFLGARVDERGRGGTFRMGECER